MEIKKNYDVKELAGKLRGRIKINNESDTRFVDIDILTAVGILDVLEEIGRMEKEGKKGKTVIDRLSPASPSQDGNKKAPENMKAGCKTEPRCFGKYTVDDVQEMDCTHCPDEVKCYLMSCRKKCFGTYVDTSSICANCTYVCECKKTTEEWDNE